MAPEAAPQARAPWVGLVGGLLLVVVSMTLPRLLDWQVYARADPEEHGTVEPLHGFWDPQWFGPGTVPALLLAVAGVVWGPRLAARLPWRGLLLTTYAVGLAWMLSLALTDGRDGVSHVLANPYEYFDTALATDDVPAALREYVERIPRDHPDNWPTHVAGHPPGALLVFVAMVRLGLDTTWTAGLAVTVLAALAAPLVLVTLRALDAEAAARRAAPFLALSPAAIFMCVSADGMFAAFAAGGLAALALAATARRRGRSSAVLLGWSVLAGLVLGWCVMSSYGLPLLGLLALAVLLAARGSWWPLPVAAAAALAVVVSFVPFGYSWFEAYPVLKDRYWDGLASDRPGTYWTWGNLGALLLSGGPLLAAGVATVLVLLWQRRRTASALHPALVLPLAALLTVLVATASQMSRAEVERIWLPFIPWLTVSVAVLPPRWRAWGLGLQVLAALVVETLLYTSW
ncbi:MAG: hypothetical protein CMH83_03655 [Nocardioides sp.]|nr:hypothetical protein [Nocardioides sp.]